MVRENKNQIQKAADDIMKDPKVYEDFYGARGLASSPLEKWGNKQGQIEGSTKDQHIPRTIFPKRGQ